MGGIIQFNHINELPADAHGILHNDGAGNKSWIAEPVVPSIPYIHQMSKSVNTNYQATEGDGILMVLGTNSTSAGAWIQGYVDNASPANSIRLSAVSQAGGQNIAGCFVVPKNWYFRWNYGNFTSATSIFYYWA